LRHSDVVARLSTRSHAILKKVLCGDNGINTRHLALDPITEVFDLTPDALQTRFVTHAPALAVAAAKRALEDAQSTAGEMDAVLISTRTFSRLIWWAKAAVRPCQTFAPPSQSFLPAAPKKFFPSASRFAALLSTLIMTQAC
jgi:3-oxoacyl-[acyl-carrier-protein] synthase III